MFWADTAQGTPKVRGTKRAAFNFHVSDERTWQFYNTVHCKVTRQSKTEVQMG